MVHTYCIKEESMEMEEDSMKAWTGSILVLREEVTDRGVDSPRNVHCLVVCINTQPTVTHSQYTLYGSTVHVKLDHMFLRNCTDRKCMNGLCSHSF